MFPGSRIRPMALHSDSLRCADVSWGSPLRFTWDGQTILAYPEETIAVALLAAGQSILRRAAISSQPRGLFCNMGVCFDCLVTVDGRAGQRACQVRVAEGMDVRSESPAALDPLT
jgi:predicted molibdopterin-dependent oxidoreductase YjgC